MKQQDKKSEMFIAHNSYQTATIEQEVQTLEFEGRKVEVTKVEADGFLTTESGVLIEWGYSDEEQAVHTVESFIYKEYRYEYNTDTSNICKEAYKLVDGLVTFADIVKKVYCIMENVHDEWSEESQAECRAERGPSCETWGAPHPFDY